MNEKTNTYEAPFLVKVGEAQDAIRGLMAPGYDLDGTFLNGPGSGGGGQEFQTDLERKD